MGLAMKAELLEAILEWNIRRYRDDWTRSRHDAEESYM